MAGDWIKMRVALAYDLKVTVMARTINQGHFLEQLAPDGQLQDGACNVDALQLLVIGALHKFWCAVQEVTTDGVLHGFSDNDIDCMVGVCGFSQALKNVGWLAQNADGTLEIPKFQVHNGDGAKKRAQTLRRVTKHRDEKRSSVTREEQQQQQEQSRDIAAGKQQAKFSLSGLAADADLRTVLVACGVTGPSLSKLVRSDATAERARAIWADIGTRNGEVRNPPGLLASSLAAEFDVTLSRRTLSVTDQDLNETLRKARDRARRPKP